jgi:hypothetical protein
MLLRNKKKNPKVIIMSGMVFVLLFFLMNVLPRFTPVKEGDLYDGVHGMFLGVAMGLMMWGTYLDAKRRRSS